MHSCDPVHSFRAPFHQTVITSRVNDVEMFGLTRSSEPFESDFRRHGKEYDTRCVRSTTATNHVQNSHPRSVRLPFSSRFPSQARCVSCFHDTIRASVTRRGSRSACSSDRESIFSATNALASSISSSTHLTFSVASSLRDASFRIHPCSLRPRTFPPPSRERERLSRPKTPSIDRAESVVRTELPTRPLTETNSLLKGVRHRMLSCSFRLGVEQARFRPMTISRFCHRDPSSDVGSSKQRTVLVRLAPFRARLNQRSGYPRPEPESLAHDIVD